MKIIYIILFIYMSVVSGYNYVLNIGSTGLLIPYSLGAIGYIKKTNYITNYKLIGTSGGAYCSLLYKYEKDLTQHDYIWKKIFELNEDTKIDLYNMHKFQNNTIKILLDRYKNEIIKEDDNINIIATKYNNILNNEKVVFSNFNNISDLIHKCHCSSYIPYISGNKLYYKYDNMKYYDGAFNSEHKVKSKYVENNKIINKIEDNIFNINCNSWGREWDINNKHYLDYKTSKKLFNYGWEDTKKYLKFIL